MKLIAGSSNIILAKDIATILCAELLNSKIDRFCDHEIFVELIDSVCNEDVFIIQSLCHPVNDNIMELLFIIDAVKRASAKRITVVIPYFGYSRQDRITSKSAISAKVVANIFAQTGANKIITIDLHSAQIMGFFDIPIDHLSAQSIFVSDITQNFALENSMIISPDIGGVLRAQDIANKLSSSLSIIDKRRREPGSSYVNNIIGNVSKKDCIIIDDIVDSGGTLCNAAQALIEGGANSVTAYITHGVLSSIAANNIMQSKLKALVISDSIINEEKVSKCSKIRVISIASIMAEAIKKSAVNLLT